MEVNYNESMNSSRDLVADRKWQKLFPKCVSDRERSSIFMTRALYVAFSLILQRREIINKDCFSKNYIAENMKCQTLSFQNEKGLAIATQLKSAGESIRKGFLKELSLVITENEDDIDAIEVYAFKFHYFENGEVAAEMTTKADGKSPQKTPMERLMSSSYQSTAVVRDQLIMLVRSISLMCQKILKPLPPVYSAQFRVHYTDEAPEEFKIAGFDPSETFYTLADNIQSAVLGHVRPGHHGAIMDCSSRFMDDAYEAETSMKRQLEKVVDEMGYEENNTFYATMETEEKPQENTPTRSDTVATESLPENVADKSIEILTTKLGTTTVESPRAVRSARREAAAAESAKSGRASPYSKPTRSRK